MIAFDLDAARAMTQIEVDLAGRAYTIPPLSALDWLDLLLDHCTWSDIVPGLLIDAGPVEDAVLDGAIDPDELKEAAHDALTAAAGVRWSVALNLIALADRPDLGGELVLHRVDPATVPLAGYLVACYQLALRRMTTKEQLASFELLLTTPPAGQDPEEWFDEADAADSWMAALAGQGGGAG